MRRRNYDSDIDNAPRRPRRRSTKSPETNLIVVLAVVGGCILLVIGAAVGGYFIIRGKPIAEPVVGPTLIANETDQLKGRWESTFRDPTGRVVMRKLKEINGNSETATWYRPDGSVFRVNRVAFELTTRGQSKVFRYFNGWAVEGNGAGHPFPSGEYVYTLEGDTWTEYGLNGETIVWTRKR